MSSGEKRWEMILSSGLVAAMIILIIIYAIQLLLV